MDTRDTHPIDTPLAQRLVDFRRRTLPALVWSVSVLIVIAMLVGRASRVEYIGLAQSLEYKISPTTTGTIETVVVDLYDTVEPGDLVAKLDDEPVLASIATANASIRQLTAELESARATLLAESGQGVASWTADLRRFQMDEEQRRLDRLSLRVEVESDQVELERLEIETQRAAQLLEAGLISQTEYDITRLLRNEVRERLEENLVLLSQTEEEYRVATERRHNYQRQHPRLPPEEPRLRPLREAIEVASRQLREIEIQRESLVLRSPVRGQVSQILARTGQSVVPGEPVVLIAEEGVREIIAFLAENDSRPIAPNTPVLVSTQHSGRAMAESIVLRVGPSIQALPERLWRNPGVPDYGRPVVIAAAPTMRLTPGETVNVQFAPQR